MSKTPFPPPADDGIHTCEESPSRARDHVVSMWTPFPFDERKYRSFFPDSLFFRAAGFLLLHFIFLLVPAIGRLFWGLRIEGEENLEQARGGCVTVSNHVHLLDCVMTAYALRSRKVCFPTLKSNFQIPLVRHIIRLLGAVPILDSKAGLTATFSQLAGHIRRGNVAHFYPEGVLDPYCRKLRGFHRGAFALAGDCGAPVIPMVILFRERTGPGKILCHRPAVTFRILPPVYPDPDPSLSKSVRSRLLCQETAARMQAEIDRFYSSSETAHNPSVREYI